jgi:hypothetical protein
MIKFQSQGQSDNRVLASVYNTTNSVLPAGAVTALAVNSSGVYDGIAIGVPASGALDLVAGIVASSPNVSATNTGIQPSSFGFIVIYGVASNVSYSVAASGALGLGDNLIPVASNTYLTLSATSGNGVTPKSFVNLVVNTATVSTTTIQTVSVFVKCM